MDQAKLIEIDTTTEIVVFDEFESELDKLLEESSSLVFDYTDPKQLASAKSHVYKFRKARGRLDTARKEAKADALLFGRMVETKAGLIKTKIDQVIDAHDKIVKEMAETETNRLETHESNLATLKDYEKLSIETPAETIQQYLEYAESFPVNDSLEEFQKKAENVKHIAILELTKLLENRVKYDSEQEELAELRKKNEEREAQDEADRVALEAKEQADRDEQIEKENKDRDRVQAQNNKMLVFTNYKTHSLENIDIATFEDLLKGMREMEITEAEWDVDFILEAKDAKTRAIMGLMEAIDRRKKYDADKTELQRLQDESRENAAQEEQRQKEQEEKEVEELAAKKREEDHEHRKTINNQAVDGLVKAGLSKEVAKKAVCAIAKKQIPNIVIIY